MKKAYNKFNRNEREEIDELAKIFEDIVENEYIRNKGEK